MSTRQRLVSTRAMRPMTRSPIEGVYRAERACSERSLLVGWRVPARVAWMEEGGWRVVPCPLGGGRVSWCERGGDCGDGGEGGGMVGMGKGEGGQTASIGGRR